MASAAETRENQIYGHAGGVRRLGWPRRWGYRAQPPISIEARLHLESSAGGKDQDGGPALKLMRRKEDPRAPGGHPTGINTLAAGEAIYNRPRGVWDFFNGR